MKERNLVTQEIATIKVQLDGDTFDFELPAEVVNIDTGDASAVAERNNVVRQELTGWKPETAEGEFEWTTSSEGGSLLKVTRKTKTKGQLEGAMGVPDDLNPVLRHLLAASAKVPLALGLALTLRALEISGRLDAVTLLRCRRSILEARAQVNEDTSYPERVLQALSKAEAKPSPWTPIGF
jgi:hypothetical protein